MRWASTDRLEVEYLTTIIAAAERERPEPNLDTLAVLAMRQSIGLGPVWPP
jgi:hypothetical protein